MWDCVTGFLTEFRSNIFFSFVTSKDPPLTYGDGQWYWWKLEKWGHVVRKLVKFCVYFTKKNYSNFGYRWNEKFFVSFIYQCGFIISYINCRNVNQITVTILLDSTNQTQFFMIQLCDFIEQRDFRQFR